VTSISRPGKAYNTLSEAYHPISLLSFFLKTIEQPVDRHIQEGELKTLRRMASSGMLRRVTLVRTDVSEERSASIIRACVGC
jgi:hypothetical protein